jgi:hypothetical protein
MRIQCDNCGVLVDGETVPLAWVTSVENDVTLRFCERCARENLRAIEAKLDRAWW